MSIEDRLRAHYTERTANEPLPGPDTEESLDRLLAAPEVPAVRVEMTTTNNNVRHFPIRPLALAAAFLAICAVAGVVVAQRDDKDNSFSTENGEDSPEPDSTAPSTVPETPTTSAPASTSDTTIAPPPSASGTSVIVGPYGPLGWWDGTRWVQAEAGVQPPVAGGEQYSIVRLADPITTAVGRLGDGCGISEEPGTIVDVGIEEGPEVTPTPIGVTGVPDPRPRPVQVLDPSGGDYKTAAVAVLAGLGIDDQDPDIVQAVKADLDGDGADEVVVVAERISDPDGLMQVRPGDYGVVFVRQVGEQGVRTTVVTQSVAKGAYGSEDVYDPEAGMYFFMEALRLSALADLNGDGRMEVVVDSLYYEGSGMSVFDRQQDGSFKEVIEGGCGA